MNEMRAIMEGRAPMFPAGPVPGVFFKCGLPTFKRLAQRELGSLNLRQGRANSMRNRADL